ncbi:MAG: hypothetical protein HKN21_08250 [Candidatus Eisenbacteria bacterium]|uniref:Uncharacterized protein n=1 Tax=Eiseniibacteriota bacterium TaxID=2212470 RepID=A0A7Y2E9G1_UNCEI|nr:hypothetical protein [Candidatus Eisenbacteria bacterium]
MNGDFSEYFNIIAAFAFILGGGNLLKIHLEKISRKKRGWGYSVVTIVGFLFVLLAGVFKIGNPEGLTGSVDTPGSWFAVSYDSFFTPLQSTMFSILAFFVASASYRAFRAKNTEATLLLTAALIILLGRTFVGYWLTAWMPESMYWATIPELSGWIMSVVNQAGQRAILIGIALGVISTSLKVILGIERSYLGGE